MEEKEQLIRWSEIEPLCLIRLLLRKLWLIVLAALIGVMGVSIVLTCLVSRSYSSTVTFVVTPRSGGSVYHISTSTASSVASIYSELLQSNVMNNTVHEALGSGISGTISASQLGSTNLINVTATSDSPKNALLMIQAVIDHYPELSDYVSSTAVLTVLDTPTVNVVPSKVYNERMADFSLSM